MTEPQIISNVHYIALGTSILPLLLIAYKFKTLKRKLNLWLGLFLVSSALSFILLLSQTKSSGYYWLVFNLNLLITIYFISKFYSYLLRSQTLKSLILYKPFMATAIFAIEFLYKGQITVYFEFTALSVHFFIGSFSVFYFFELLNKNTANSHLEESGGFWINAAVLLLFGGAFLVELTYDIILKYPINQAVYSGLIISVLGIVANLLFSLGLTTRKIRQSG